MQGFINREDRFIIVYEKSGSNIKLMSREAFDTDFYNGKYREDFYIVEGQINEDDARRFYKILWNSRNEPSNYIEDESSINLIR